jgi:NTE family protein
VGRVRDLVTAIEPDERIVSPAPTEPEVDDPYDAGGEIGLCLSGGGYRAMLFHLGALWRLNEFGYLPRIDRISSVSGGSIIAAILGMTGPSSTLASTACPHDSVTWLPSVHSVASRTLDVKAVLAGLLLPGSSVGWHLTWLYDRHIFKRASLKDLPDESAPANPRFVINATNLQSGALWRFARVYSWDYRVGKIEEPTNRLAQIVAASSAFPPVLSPARFRFAECDYRPQTGKGSQKAPFTTRPVLSDGGVYDNLGLQPVWNGFQTVLISDGGGAMQPHPGALWKLRFWRWRDWGTQTVPVLSVIDNQVRALRKRQAIESFKADPTDPHHRLGTYWGIRSHVADYHLDSSLECPADKTLALAQTKTRLKRLDRHYQERLVNWGYAICDTAMRKWVDDSLSAPTNFAYPEAGL